MRLPVMNLSNKKRNIQISFTKLETIADKLKNKYRDQTLKSINTLKSSPECKKHFLGNCIKLGPAKREIIVDIYTYGSYKHTG